MIGYTNQFGFKTFVLLGGVYRLEPAKLFFSFPLLMAQSIANRVLIIQLIP